MPTDICRFTPTATPMKSLQLSVSGCITVENNSLYLYTPYKKLKVNSVAFSPQANYTDRATAACRQIQCQLLRIEGVAWSAQRIPTVYTP
jgi:hypothetical protein